MKPLFTHGPSLNLRLTMALLASLTLFVLDTRLNYFAPVRMAMSSMLYPIQLIADLPNEISQWSDDFFQTRSELKKRNQELESIQLLSSMRLQKLQWLERENMRLKELLGSSFRLTERVLVAELLTIDLDPFTQQVVINKGKNDGVFLGQPALDASGVMGQVTAIDRFSSRVMLLTDPSHSIPVQINRNGLRAVVTGRGLGLPLLLQHLPHNADVRVGDLLVTSGLGGRFPSGYPVGVVTDIKLVDGQTFAEIAVKPAAKLSTSRELLLVLAKDKLNAIVEQLDESDGVE